MPGSHRGATREDAKARRHAGQTRTATRMDRSGLWMAPYSRFTIPISPFPAALDFGILNAYSREEEVEAD